MDAQSIQQAYINAYGLNYQGYIPADIFEPRKLRNYKPKPNYSIIGIKEPVLVLSGGVGVTKVKEDFTTYQDRAVLQLKNNTSSDILLYGGSIRGKRVIRISGTGGYLWEYSDYDSIEKNGEKSIEVNSDYIVNATQCKAVGDYTWKESQPHKVYTLALQGLQYWLDVGDVYTLDLQYALSTGNIENISTDIEVIAVNFVKSVGTLGATEVLCRVPSAAWVLTTTTPARLTGAGSATRLENRSNIVTVAPGNWAGIADYYCDGTDDEVKINEAIDYVNSVGGGTVELTTGIFYPTNKIVLKDNVILRGNNTVIRISSSSSICIEAKCKCNITDIIIDGTGITHSNSITLKIIDAYEGSAVLENIKIENIYKPDNNLLTFVLGAIICNNVNINNSEANDIVAFSTCDTCNNCRVSYLETSAGDDYMIAFALCKNINSCFINNNTAGTLVGFTLAERIINCFFNNNTSSVLMYCFNLSSNISNCISKDNTSYEYVGYNSSTTIVSCLSTSNTGTLTEAGFSFCNSVQQCKTDDTTKYTNSYADAGTSYACNDTPNGGFNS